MSRLWPRSPRARPPRPPGDGWVWSQERGWHDGLDRLADRYMRDEIDLIDFLLAVATYPASPDPTVGGRLCVKGQVRTNEYGETSIFDGRRWHRVGADHPAWRDPRAARLHNERDAEKRKAWHEASDRAKRRAPMDDLAVLRRLRELDQKLAATESKLADASDSLDAIIG